MKGIHLNRPYDHWLHDILTNEKSISQLLQKFLGIKSDRKKQNIIYLFFRFKIYKTNAASWNELKPRRLGFFCQGWRIKERLNCFQVLSFLSLCFKIQKIWSCKTVTAFIAMNFIQYPVMILENTNLSRNIIKILIFLSLL